MASTISFSGLGSGIDFGQIRDAIVADQTRPVTQLQQKATDDTSRVSALQQLNASLATLTAATSALTDPGLGTGRTASSSNATAVSATASTAASPGTYNISVNRLATSLAQASASFASATGTPILAGGATSATFELRKGGATSGTPITVDSTNNSLAGLRDAINKANAGVTASIVDVAGDGTQNQLVLTSTATGAAGRVQLVETSGTGTDAALNLRSLNPPGATTDFSSLDASLSVNGLSITRPTNTISDAVTGLTLNLQQTGTSAITVASGSDITTKLQAFVNAYNSVQGFINGQTKTDAQGHPTGVLANESTLRNVQQEMRGALNAISSNNGGSLTNLTDLGIGRDQNDNLTLDTTALSTQLANKPNDVKALIQGTGGQTGIFNSIYTTFNNMSDSTSGQVQTAITGYQSTISWINKSVADQMARITALSASLTKQYAAIDASLSQLNGQGTALTNMLNAMNSGSTNKN